MSAGNPKGENSTEMRCSFQKFSKILIRSVLLICMQGILDVSCTTGKMYIFALPRMIHFEPKIISFLYALKNRKVEVYYSYNGSASRALMIPARDVLKFEFPINDISFQDQGPCGVYKLHSNTEFILTLLLLDSEISLDVIQVIPVEAWVKVYYAATLTRTPSVQIFTNEGVNLIQVCFMSSFPYTFQITYDSVKYMKDSTLELQLNADGGFSISDCHNKTDPVGSLTGTRITGSMPLGVISGSCYGATSSVVCDTFQKNILDSSRDIAADMLLPTSGTNIITPHIEGRYSGSDVLLVATADNTTVNYTDDPGQKQIILKTDRSSKFVSQKFGPMRLESDKPIYVFFVLVSSCYNTSDKYEWGDPALTVVSPVLHYYDSYAFSVFDWNQYETMHYISIVIQTRARYSLMINFTPLQARYTGRSVFGTVDWYTLTFQTKPGVYYVHTANSAPFAVFVYGFGPQYGYMYSARQLFADPPPLTTARTTGGASTRPYQTTTNSKITAPPCEKTEMHVNDGIDNDCDGVVDEETAPDEKDNDNDGLVDEDIGHYPLKSRNGSWGEWSSWMCPSDCYSTHYYRIRQCDNPQPTTNGKFCEGEGKETQNKLCFSAQSCPYDCPDYTYGLNCDRKCPNCESPCDKKNGSCVHCLPGWTNPRMGCKDACPAFTFGEGCKGDCGKKCKKDCLHKHNGQCNECSSKRWGIDCKDSCVNCVTDCSKTNGVCFNCKPGFKNGNHSCNIPCEAGEFGADCSQSCFEKCGADCVERVEGICPESDTLLYVLVLVMAIAPVFVALLYRSFGGKMSLVETKPVFIVEEIEENSVNEIHPEENGGVEEAEVKSASETVQPQSHSAMPIPVEKEEQEVTPLVVAT
ncbi:scavenger receptor class F member 1 [Biomphalaria glabrata]|nr:scavenger receptor class F member 1-like; partial [Biomphalaria glabrata]